ncbi:hypothetical protein CYMTET_2943 [Cymbomonas tetramitiformis]|uniref:Uncharacterized protein n=1 Tax=Cymbomonas tetramitiformis TaxID=36881 RepID=A0AAE0LM20_9CHLO|nr:hypothetical protein CYMTET_2943 [Cymbomonas tetramitiformis]
MMRGNSLLRNSKVLRMPISLPDSVYQHEFVLNSRHTLPHTSPQIFGIWGHEKRLVYRARVRATEERGGDARVTSSAWSTRTLDDAPPANKEDFPNFHTVTSLLVGAFTGGSRASRSEGGSEEAAEQAQEEEAQLIKAEEEKVQDPYEAELEAQRRRAQEPLTLEYYTSREAVKELVVVVDEAEGSALTSYRPELAAAHLRAAGSATASTSATAPDDAAAPVASPPPPPPPGSPEGRRSPRRSPRRRQREAAAAAEEPSFPSRAEGGPPGSAAVPPPAAPSAMPSGHSPGAGADSTARESLEWKCADCGLAFELKLQLKLHDCEGPAATAAAPPQQPPREMPPASNEAGAEAVVDIGEGGATAIHLLPGPGGEGSEPSVPLDGSAMQVGLPGRQTPLVALGAPLLEVRPAWCSSSAVGAHDA